MIMLAMKQQNLTHSFLGFVNKASNILHIKSKADYEEALETIEYLFNQAKDKADEPLNDLIDILSKAIERYESSQKNMLKFDREACDINHEISVFRVLIAQHHLTVADFKNEIGSKYLVSMILNGKRNLTKEHIITHRSLIFLGESKI